MISKRRNAIIYFFALIIIFSKYSYGEIVSVKPTETRLFEGLIGADAPIQNKNKPLYILSGKRQYIHNEKNRANGGNAFKISTLKVIKTPVWVAGEFPCRSDYRMKSVCDSRLSETEFIILSQGVEIPFKIEETKFATFWQYSSNQKIAIPTFKLMLSDNSIHKLSKTDKYFKFFETYALNAIAVEESKTVTVGGKVATSRQYNYFSEAYNDFIVLAISANKSTIDRYKEVFTNQGRLDKTIFNFGTYKVKGRSPYGTNDPFKVLYLYPKTGKNVEFPPKNI
jgi:hypothetical protein